MLKRCFAIAILFLLASCATLRPPRLSEEDKSRLLSRLKSSDSPVAKSVSASLLLMHDSKKYTPVVGEQVAKETNQRSVAQLLACLARWGTMDGAKYVEPFLEDERVVSVWKSEKGDRTITVRDVAAESIGLLQIPKPKSGFPRNFYLH